MDFNQIEKEYEYFYAPKFNILVDGESIFKFKRPAEIFSVTVNNSLDNADDFSFSVNNPIEVEANKRDFPYLRDGVFEVGKEIKILMGYKDHKSLETVLTGLITAVDITFPANGISQLTVRGYDYSHKMMKEKRSENYGSSEQQVTFSDIVRRINSDQGYQLDLSGVTNTREQHRQIKQEQESDYDFIKKKLAERISYEFFVQQDKLFFRPPANDQTSFITSLSWGKSLISFSPQVNIANQVSAVEVRHWDPASQQPIVGRANAGDEQGRDRQGSSGAERVRQSQGETVQYIWRPINSQEEAENLARSILNKISEGLVKGSGECLGIPKIMPGMNIELTGLGKKFSKVYYIEKTIHSVSSSGYKT